MAHTSYETSFKLRQMPESPESARHVVGTNVISIFRMLDDSSSDKMHLLTATLPGECARLPNDVYAGVELACLDACGKATGRRVCELLGGPVRNEVEFAAYLFYRYAADHPKLLADRRIVDRRGRGKRALDDWGEVRTPRSNGRRSRSFPKAMGLSGHEAQSRSSAAQGWNWRPCSP